MSKLLLSSLLATPAIAGVLMVSGNAVAADSAATTAAEQSPASLLQSQSLTVRPDAPQATAVPTFSNAAPIALEPQAGEPATAIAPASQAAQPVAPVTVAPVTQVAQAAPGNLDQINRYSREGRAINAANQMGQVTSVSQLTDVRPTDWAFQALQSLVERYGCIVGYPDRTYRGNQALTRFEFAAGLNACLDRVSELIAAATADLVRKEDLEVLRKLQEEFAAELATLRGRVDALEARTATLEKQQFSTTTKLAGEVIFGITDELGQPFDNETVFQNRVRLALNTSFTGKDLLVTRLAAGNVVAFQKQGGIEGEPTQSWQAGSTGENSVFVDWVAYFGTAFDDKLKFYIPAIGGLHYDYTPTLSPALDAFDGGTGPLSYFGQRNPIYAIGGGSGLGVSFQFQNFTISAGYLADNSVDGTVTASANNPNEGFGLFNGSYSAMAQVAFTGNNFGIGATYVNAFRRDLSIFNAGVGEGLTGTSLANLSPTTIEGISGLAGSRTEVNAFGLSGYFKFGNNITVNAFGMFADADVSVGGFELEDGEIWSYGLGIAFQDLGKKGNLAGLVAGVQPYLGNSAPFNNDIPLHFEGFYKYQLNDNISITPGVIWILNPGQSDGNDDVIIGTVRTTFTF
jgi:hypothetical protein